MLKGLIVILLVGFLIFSAWGYSGVKRYGFMFSGEKFRLAQVVPKIFIPESGNRVRFTFANPYFGGVTIKIYSVSGEEIRKNLTWEEENISMYWDGKDEDNRVVRGGIYIYQIEAEGKIINGTIIVVK